MIFVLPSLLKPGVYGLFKKEMALQWYFQRQQSGWYSRVSRVLPLHLLRAVEYLSKRPSFVYQVSNVLAPASINEDRKGGHIIGMIGTIPIAVVGSDAFEQRFHYTSKPLI